MPEYSWRSCLRFPRFGLFSNLRRLDGKAAKFRFPLRVPVRLPRKCSAIRVPKPFLSGGALFKALSIFKLCFFGLARSLQFLDSGGESSVLRRDVRRERKVT